MLRNFVIIFFCLNLQYSYADIVNSKDFQSKNLPEGFVNITEIDPTIIVDLQYFKNDNFLGCKAKGYNANKAILTIEAAEGLKKAQDELKLKGYSLVVYDAYRPLKAVEHIIKWTEDSGDQKNKSKFYPNVAKNELIRLGYIAEQSPHSRGSSVDVSIILLNKELQPQSEIKRVLGNGSEILFIDDGTLDMGSSYNLFDEISAHNCPVVSASSDINRRMLKKLMFKHGFKSYDKEWWHYTYVKEPFPDTSFDFDIE